MSELRLVVDNAASFDEQMKWAVLTQLDLVGSRGPASAGLCDLAVITRASAAAVMRTVKSLYADAYLHSYHVTDEGALHWIMQPEDGPWPGFDDERDPVDEGEIAQVVLDQDLLTALSRRCDPRGNDGEIGLDGLSERVRAAPDAVIDSLVRLRDESRIDAFSTVTIGGGGVMVNFKLHAPDAPLCIDEGSF